MLVVVRREKRKVEKLFAGFVAQNNVSHKRGVGGRAEFFLANRGGFDAVYV